MKNLLLTAVLGTLCLAAGSQEQVPEPLGQVTVTAPRIALPANPYRMHFSDFREFKGNYYFPDGQRLWVNGFGHKMYVKMDNQEYVEIVAASPNEFVAVNERMEMTFSPDNSAPQEVTVRMLVPRDDGLAGAPPRMVTLLARR